MATPETKPTLQAYTWCESGTPTTDIDSTGGDVAHGWAASTSPPPRQRFNWFFKWVMQAIRFLLHRGIPDYDAAETYAVNDRVQDSNGLTYKCIQANTPLAAKDPTTQPNYWAAWGIDGSALDGKVACNPGLAGDVTLSAGTLTQAVAYVSTGNGLDSKLYKLLAHATVVGDAITITGSIGGESVIYILGCSVSVVGNATANVGITSCEITGSSAFSAHWVRVTGASPGSIVLDITLWGT